MSKEAIHQQLINTKHSGAQNRVYANAKISFDLIQKGPIYRTLNQGSRIFQNVTKSTVFTT